MASNGKRMTWLEKLEEQLDVDVDCMDPEYVRNLPVRPHDQTSNQIFVDLELGQPSNQELLAQTARELKDKGWVAIYTRMAVLMCKKNIDAIRGRVLLQTLPSEAYNTKATIEHARLYGREFELAGIPRDRFCIKIPATGPALDAARQLADDDIPTLGTAVFGLPQAIACSQAGCLYISPYFNEIRAHNDLSLWPDVADPATQHPMSRRVIQMLETYKTLHEKTGKQQPLIKNAGFISAKEAMAAGEMGCHSATILRGVLDELARLEYDGSAQPGEGAPKPANFYSADAAPLPARLQCLLEQTAGAHPATLAAWDGALADTGTDYLAGGGEALTAAIAADPVSGPWLRDALDVFIAAENRSKAKVEAALAAL